MAVLVATKIVDKVAVTQTKFESQESIRHAKKSSIRINYKNELFKTKGQ